MESKVCNKCKEDKPLNAFYKAKNKKCGLRGECKECSKAKNSKYYAKNSETIKERTKQYKLDNPEKCRESARPTKAKWNAANQDKIAAYRIKHSGSDKHKKARSNWLKNNRDKGRSYCAKYRSAKAQRRPAWANVDLISAFHAEAKRLEELTGIKFHVDHIIPMQGELVSGLDVETNLQILTAHENMSKSNSFDPELFVA